MTPEQMEQRITNLEVALHGLWALIKDLQPPATQESVDGLLSEHFNVSSDIGGLRRGHFDIEG